MRNETKKYRPCNCRTALFSFLSFMLFFLTIVFFLTTAKREEKHVVFFLICIFFLMHIIFVLYSLMKLNSFICLDEFKITQKQFGKIMNIKYDEITQVKLSFAFYVRAPYAIKIYANNIRIMFEITSKVFDVFMEHCSNIEIKEQINSLLKENGIY